MLPNPDSTYRLYSPEFGSRMIAGTGWEYGEICEQESVPASTPADHATLETLGNHRLWTKEHSSRRKQEEPFSVMMALCKNRAESHIGPKHMQRNLEAVQNFKLASS